MTENLSEKLEQLSAAASPKLGVSVKALTQLLRLGAEHQRPRADDWADFPAEQDAEFICQLVASYRTGLLVVAQADDATVDRVARSLAPHLEGGREFDQMPKTRSELKIWRAESMCSTNDATQDDAIDAAKAAIRALKSPKPPIL